MSNRYNIKIPAGLGLRAGTILEPDAPTSESLREIILGLCLSGDDMEAHAKTIKSLVEAYISLSEFEGEELIEVSDHDRWAAEAVYMEYVVKGWRKAVKRDFPEAVKSRTDEEVYEECPWYDFGKMVWPAQLIAEVGYLVGYKTGRESVALSREFMKQQANA